MGSLVMAAALLLAPFAAETAERVALLIGNAEYSQADFALRNPVNDVLALKPKLEGLGFRVTTVANAGRVEMEAALRRFGEALDGTEMGFLFYAGHGLQLGGENLLLDSNLASQSEAGLKEAAITLTEMRQIVEAAKPELGIIVIDACREYPEAARGDVVLDGRGLKRESGGAGLLIAYSTDPGNVAYDGVGANSEFTTALLEHIDSPALDVRLMFGRVRQAVVVATGGRQVPWVEESVLGEHFLNTSISEDNLRAQIERDVASWREVSGTIKPEPYRAYLAEFPDGLFRDFAEQRLARFSMVPQMVPETSLGAKAHDLEFLVTSEDAPKLGEALILLGYLPSGPEATQPAELRRGLESYLAQQEGTAFEAQKLYVEAARVGVFNGVWLGQRLRVDVVALSISDKLKEMMEANYELLVLLAKTDKNAKRLLPAVREGIDAIELSQAKILARLDESREYYDRLIAVAGTHFGDLMIPGLFGLEGDQRSMSRLEEVLERDLRLFLKHAQLSGDDQIRGTLSWLSDFLPKS
ncbi:MAG TPA: caspase family protein [Paracoccaceae bacterium]|nr:caspase family protein [Paracoccaceae bacterium]